MNPFALLRIMSEQMDRAYTEAFEEPTAHEGVTWMPALDVREKDGKLTISADLPGIEMKDVKVEVNGDVLTIEGERRRETEQKDEHAHRIERSHGRFHRAIQLPEGAQADQARAEFRNGVLEVTMPVAQDKVNRRQIPVQAATARAVEAAAGAESTAKTR
jgi:HSP20 family protein